MKTHFKKLFKILKYIGIALILIVGIFIFLVAKNSSDTYLGGPNLITNEWCDYGYNPDDKQCCQDDDYSCEFRDKGAIGECYDQTFSFSKNHRGTCSGHRGVLQWYK